MNIPQDLHDAVLHLNTSSAVVLGGEAFGLRGDMALLILRDRAVDFLETLNRVHADLLLPNRQDQRGTVDGPRYSGDDA